MNPKRVRTLHDGVEIPAPEGPARGDPHRTMRAWSWVVLIGAPLCVLLLVNDFLWLPNGEGSRYSSAAALRDSALFGKTDQLRRGPHTSSLGVAWPNLYVIAWMDDDGWYAAAPGEAAYRARTANGTAPVSWERGGDVMVWMPSPGTRVGLWAMSWRIEPYVQVMDATDPLLSTAALPAPAMDQIRAALVRVGGPEAGADFVRAGAFVGFTMARRLEPLGLAHNLGALGLLLASVVGLGLWPSTFRRYRRLRRGLCFGCGYPLRGTPAAICPECGKRFERSARYPG